MKIREQVLFFNHCGKATSLTCNVFVAVRMQFNLLRHYDTNLINFSKFTGQTRKDKISRLKNLKTAEFCNSKANH